MFRVLNPSGATPREISEVVNNTMNGKTNNTGLVTLNTGWATTTTIYDERIGYDSIILITPASNAAEDDTAPYGAFQDATTQTAASANTAYAINFDTTDLSNGIYLSNGSRINVRNTGTYNLQFSSQFVNTDTQIHDADIWLRKNGTNVAGSNGQVSVPNNHGSVNGRLLSAWNYVITLTAGDYVELIWNVTNTQVYLEYIPPQTSPTRPSTASVIATMQYISPLSTDNVFITSQAKGEAIVSHFANNTADKTFKYLVVG
jgi:hypothetical protein